MTGGVAAPVVDRVGRHLRLAVASVLASAVFMAWWLHWFDMVDLQVYRAGAGALLHRRDIYQARPPGSNLPFTYPPFAALAFVPLGVLPDLAARVAMSLASAASLLVVMMLALRRAAPGWSRRSRWTVALAVCAAAPFLEPLRDTFRLGQVNLILVALVMIDLLAAAVADDGRPRPWRGALLGVATAVKLTPGVFILYLLATRRFREAATALVTATVATVSAFALMPAASIHYWTRLLFDDKRIGSPGNVWNQSVRGVVARVTGSPDDGHLVGLALSLALLVAGLALAARFHRAGDELLGVGVVAVTGLLASPISWNHHWVWALPAGVALWNRAAVTRWIGWVGLAGAWTAVFALASITWWTFDGHDNYRLGDLQNVEAACYVLAGLILLALLARPAALGRRPLRRRRGDVRTTGAGERRGRSSWPPCGAAAPGGNDPGTIEPGR